MAMHGIRGVYLVDLRCDGMRFARPQAHAALDGRMFEFRPGWQLGGEERAQFVNELAMIPVRDNPEHPYPEDGPDWMPSGDLVPDGMRIGDLVEQASR